jgi:hypothetical protein
VEIDRIAPGRADNPQKNRHGETNVRVGALAI